MARPRPFRLLMTAALIASLAACATAPRPDAGSTPDLSTTLGVEAYAQQLLSDEQFAEAAKQYARLAQMAPEPLGAQHYALIEAEILFAHKLDEQAAKRTQRLPAEMLNTELQTRRQLLQSASDLFQQRAADALLALPDPRLIADKSLLTRYHELRFRAGAALDEGAPMFDSLIALDELEGGLHRELRNNQIWQLLTTRSELALEQLAINARSPTHAGWLALLQSLRALQAQGLDYRSTVATWQGQYNEHPALAMLLNTEQDIDSLLASGTPSGRISLMGTDAIALLLPFNDRLAKFSNAIRDGLLAAQYESGSTREIRIYNIGSNPADALPTYQRAVADGAQLVIGPLRRKALESLVRYGELSTPVIALNYLPRGGADNLIQFGLSPEDEARDAANYMAQAGLRTAAMILPDTEAGARSGEAFRQQLERWGGEVVASETLDGTRKDYRKELSALLLINDSLQRRRNIQGALDTSLVFETRTRTDLDAIFAPVSPAIGRVLKPQLDFHSAQDTPLLASSSIYSGSPQPGTDNDLNGTLFNDIPWLLEASSSREGGLRKSAAKLKLSEGPLARFFALGIDAYRVTEQLPSMLQDNNYLVEGATGKLLLSPERRIRRHLAWAEFTAGNPKSIPYNPTPMEPPPPTSSLFELTETADDSPGEFEGELEGSYAEDL